MARALVEKASKLVKPDNLSIRAYAYYGDMDGKQWQKDFSDINVTWSKLDYIAYIIQWRREYHSRLQVTSI